MFDLIYPRTCGGCHSPLLKSEKLICTTCLFNLPKTGWENYPSNPMKKTFAGRVPVSKTSAFLFFRKEGIVQNIMHQIKYKGQKELAYFMGYLHGKNLSKTDFTERIDIIVPVPLHPKKKKLRGFNQSWYYGKGLQKATGIECSSNYLFRIKPTETQTKKDRQQRYENMLKAFEAKEIKGQKALLIDDVITTGATLEACAETLLARNPNLQISIATMAIAE